MSYEENGSALTPFIFDNLQTSLVDNYKEVNFQNKESFILLNLEKNNNYEIKCKCTNKNNLWTFNLNPLYISNVTQNDIDEFISFNDTIIDENGYVEQSMTFLCNHTGSYILSFNNVELTSFKILITPNTLLTPSYLPYDGSFQNPFLWSDLSKDNNIIPINLHLLSKNFNWDDNNLNGYTYVYIKTFFQAGKTYNISLLDDNVSVTNGIKFWNIILYKNVNNQNEIIKEYKNVGEDRTSKNAFISFTSEEHFDVIIKIESYFDPSMILVNGIFLNYPPVITNLSITSSGYVINGNKLIDYTAEIIWTNDFNNKINSRPLNIELILLKNNIKYKSIILSNFSTSYTWYSLDKYDEYNNLIIYSLKPLELSNYTSNVNNNSITNTFIKPLISYTIQKIWDDYNNYFLNRPESIILKLLKNGSEFKTIKLTNQLSYTWNNLDVYDNNGNLITYSPDEYYESEYYEKNINDNIITNKYKLPNINLKIVKVWNDSNNIFNFRPSEVKVNILANNKLYDTIILSGDLHESLWEYEISLPKFDENTLNEIDYSLDNVLINHYNSSINNFEISSVFDMPTINYFGKKIWDDNYNSYKFRPNNVKFQLYKNGESLDDERLLSEENNWETTWDNLPKYNELTGKENIYSIDEINVPENYTKIINNSKITNVFVMPKINYSINKKWNDKNNQYNLRPVSIIVQLFSNNIPINSNVILSNKNNWSYTWNDLPKYDVYGNEILYSVDEVLVPSNYKKSIKNNQIINDFEMPLINFDVSIKWEDFNNKFNSRPKVLNITLLNGNKIELRQKVSESSKWSCSWTNLSKYDESNGNENVYIFDVDNDENYKLIDENYEKIIDLNNNQIIFKYILKPFDLKFYKIWEDDDYNTRPDNVLIQLYSNGSKNGDPIKLDKSNYLINDNVWEYTWTNLPKYNELDGSEIEYTFNEINIPNGYFKIINNESHTITNKLLKENLNLNGFSIISFNTNIDISSIKYENYEIINNTITNIQSNNLNNSNVIQDFEINSLNNYDNLGIERYWIIINDYDVTNLIIVKKPYMDDFNNIFGGPFDSQEELFMFLNNFINFNYNITIQQ